MHLGVLIDKTGGVKVHFIVFGAAELLGGVTITAIYFIKMKLDDTSTKQDLELEIEVKSGPDGKMTVKPQSEGLNGTDNKVKLLSKDEESDKV